MPAQTHYLQAYSDTDARVGLDRLDIADDGTETLTHLIPPVYDQLSIPADGLVCAKLGDAWGYVDAAGITVIRFTTAYAYAGDFSEGLARVYAEGQSYGFIDRTGALVIPHRFPFAENFSGGMAVVRSADDLHGAINRAGDLVIPHRYVHLGPFERGHAVFGDYVRWGLVNNRGEEVVPMQYTNIYLTDDFETGGRVEVIETSDEGVARHGYFTLATGAVEWTDAAEPGNEARARYAQLSTEAAALVEKLYADGCPCTRPRFLRYAVWEHEFRFIDGEVFAAAWQAHPKLAAEPHPTDEWASLHSCTVCGSKYRRRYVEINAFAFYSTFVRVHAAPGAAPVAHPALAAEPLPMIFGFEVYGEVEGPTWGYTQTDSVADVIAEAGGE